MYFTGPVVLGDFEIIPILTCYYTTRPDCKPDFLGDGSGGEGVRRSVMLGRLGKDRNDLKFPKTTVPLKYTTALFSFSSYFLFVYFRNSVFRALYFFYSVIRIRTSIHSHFIVLRNL
jgi:hypothetical protein